MHHNPGDPDYSILHVLFAYISSHLYHTIANIMTSSCLQYLSLFTTLNPYDDIIELGAAGASEVILVLLMSLQIVTISTYLIIVH